MDDEFLVLDPSFSACSLGCLVSAASLHKARRAYGTDEDIVFVPAGQLLPAAQYSSGSPSPVAAPAEGAGSGISSPSTLSGSAARGSGAATLSGSGSGRRCGGGGGQPASVMLPGGARVASVGRYGQARVAGRQRGGAGGEKGPMIDALGSGELEPMIIRNGTSSLVSPSPGPASPPVRKASWMASWFGGRGSGPAAVKKGLGPSPAAAGPARGYVPSRRL